MNHSPTALHTFSQLLRAALDTGLDAVAIVDSDDMIVFCNRGLEQLVSLSRNDLELRDVAATLAPLGNDVERDVRRLLESTAAGTVALELKGGRVTLCHVVPLRLQGEAVFRTIRLCNVTRRHEKLPAEPKSARDVLTGLPNREVLDHRLEHVLGSESAGGPLALLLVNLHEFKRVNDRYGRAGGDSALVEIARRLREKLRDTDIVCRLEGDKFAILCEGINEAGAAEIAARIRHAVARPLVLGGGNATLHASVGCTIEWPPGGRPEHVVARAAAMMESARRLGSGAEMVRI